VNNDKTQCLACNNTCASDGILPLNLILDLYNKLFKLTWTEKEISDYSFNDIESYTCSKCGLRQFSKAQPGPAGFYKKLATELSWYYPTVRWESKPVLSRIHKNDSVVEIGCGSGQFIHFAKKSGISITGLELSEEAIERGKREGLCILHASEAKKLSENFNFLLMFQVLEHLTDPFQFLKEHIHLVKKGGYIIVSVPMLHSICGYLPDPLSWPPHHITSWTKESLTELGKRLNVQLIEIQEQPISPFFNQMKLMRNLYSKVLTTFLYSNKPEWQEIELLRNLSTSFTPTVALSLLKKQKWTRTFHSGFAVYKVN